MEEKETFWGTGVLTEENMANSVSIQHTDTDNPYFPFVKHSKTFPTGQMHIEDEKPEPSNEEKLLAKVIASQVLLLALIDELQKTVEEIKQKN